MEAGDLAARRRFLQQQGKIAGRRSTRQPASPKIDEECVQVSRVSMQVPRNDGESGGPRKNGSSRTRRRAYARRSTARDDGEPREVAGYAVAAFLAAARSVAADRSMVIDV